MMKLTPMMEQYMQIKARHEDCILFFRLGDFYEMFFKDAEIASKELELVLTGKDCGMEERAPMCGIPHHAAKGYIGRLISKGYKVAICEQVEDPALAKGIVKRDVIKIITPGTFNDDSFIDENKNNFIMTIYDEDGFLSLSFVDISTGEFYNTCFRDEISIISDEISKFKPTEILCPPSSKSIIESLELDGSAVITERPLDYFEEIDEAMIKERFGNDTSSTHPVSLKCINGIIKYIFETQKVSLTNINAIEFYSIKDTMTIDINSRRNLELTENIRDKGKRGSLLWVLDKCSTAMGSRTLRRWIDQPLITKNEIEKRLEGVEEILKNLNQCELLEEALKRIYDIERLVGKISSKNVNAKELLTLKNSIENIPPIKDILKEFNSPILKDMYDNLDELKDIAALIDESICSNPAITLKEGNIIKEGFNKYVDEYRDAKFHGKQWIASLENTEREVTGIKSLKVGYNKVFGYYIEISKANYSSIPEGRYIRKQTLANAERFITEDLKEMENKILGAEEKLCSLEYELFLSIRDSIEKQIGRMQISAKILGELDTLANFSRIALENNFVKPSINDSDELTIVEGRHPVVEKVIDSGTFVSNNTKLNCSDNELLIITGPNMAGKSTYMRQVALITIMAQIGSFVPAKEANISICDKIFTRIGASDDLSGGKSTFMVEMWEVSNILKNATNKSLVLLDEVGRGTSTYDGLSIAWSVIEYICNNKNLRCKTLFATHYHELTALEGKIQGVKNYSVAVKELNNNIIFLRKIVEGGADQSYGIEVAKLAGLPKEVVERAKTILKSLEDEKSSNHSTKISNSYENSAAVVTLDEVKEEAKKEIKASSTKKHKNKNNELQISFNDLEKDTFIQDLGEIDIMSMTPLEAMNSFYEVIRKAKKLR